MVVTGFFVLCYEIYSYKYIATVKRPYYISHSLYTYALRETKPIYIKASSAPWKIYTWWQKQVYFVPPVFLVWTGQTFVNVTKCIKYHLYWFPTTDKLVSGLLAFISAVWEGPSWNYSNAVNLVLITQSPFNKTCLRSSSEDNQSAPTGF